MCDAGAVPEHEWRDMSALTLYINQGWQKDLSPLIHVFWAIQIPQTLLKQPLWTGLL